MDMSIFDDLEKELEAFVPKNTAIPPKAVPPRMSSNTISSKSSPELWIPAVSTQRNSRADTVKHSPLESAPPAPSPQEQFLKNQLNESNQRESQLRKDLAAVKSELADKNSKILRLVEGVKEERQMQATYVEEQKARALLAEERADQLESKLLSLVEYIKNLPAPTDNQSPSSNQHQVEELKQRLAASEEEGIRLNEQIGKLEGTVNQLQIEWNEAMDFQTQLRSELNAERTRRTEAEKQVSLSSHQQEEVVALEERLKESQEELYRVNFELAETQRSLQTQIRSTEAERERTQRISAGIDPKVLEAEMKAEAIREEMEERLKKMVRILSNAKMERESIQSELNSVMSNYSELEKRSESVSEQNKKLQEELLALQNASDESKSKTQHVASLETSLEQKIMRVEALERQVQKLETSLANQQTKSQIYDDSAWTKIEDLETELKKAKSKNSNLTFELETLRNKLNSLEEERGEETSAPPPPPVIEEDNNFSAEEGGPPPPPPPGPPPPPVKMPGPLKIVKKSKPSNANNSNNNNAPAPAAAPAAPSIVDELKKGTFTLKKVTPVQRKPMEPKPEASGFAAIASELAKQRQTRLQQQTNQQRINARKSVKLTNVLSELGGL